MKSAPCCLSSTYGLAPFGCSVHTDRLGEGRIGTIQHGTRGDNAGTDPLAGRNLLTPLGEGRQVAAHITDARDSVGDEQWQKNILASRIRLNIGDMGMHIPQAGYEKMTRGLENVGTRGDGDRPGFPQGANTILSEHNGHVGLGWRPGRIYHRYVGKDDRSEGGRIVLLGLKSVYTHRQQEWDECKRVFHSSLL